MSHEFWKKSPNFALKLGHEVEAQQAQRVAEFETRENQVALDERDVEAKKRQLELFAEVANERAERASMSTGY